MYTLEIKTENGKWLVNDKPFKELTYDERELLVKFIKSFSKDMYIQDMPIPKILHSTN